MLNVNTIEFNGQKAVLNSYSDHPALADDIVRQRETWAARYPNAIVRTERLTEAETMRLVAGHGEHPSDRWRKAYDIGKASLG